MLILSRPTISTYLARTLYENQIPVVAEPELALPMAPALKLLTREEFERDPSRAYESLILTNFENALGYLYEVIPYDDRVMKSRLFKDKAAFRRAISRRFPRFFFREIPLNELKQVDSSQLPYPIVIKPTIGISSIGVARVANPTEWTAAVDYLEKELANYARNYRTNVIESHSVLLESYIPGRELAIDGYYTEDRKPVLLNLLEHLFLDQNDTSDRVYLTHRTLVQEWIDPVMKFLEDFGEIFDLKRFPFHLEVRITPEGELIPIELNPLRFSGLGTTEIAQYAYGINVYESFFRDQRPNWSQILNRKDDSIYSFFCADIPTELFRRTDLQVLDRKFFKEFPEVLEYRFLDESETSTFAVVFYRTESLADCRRLLGLDLTPFFRVN